MQPKDIFGLAVRLLGLVFLYLGLSAVAPLLDFSALQAAGGGDMLNALLPIVFHLAIAWWLLGGGLLVRRAYPENSKILPRPDAREENTTPAASSNRSEGTTDSDVTDKKLASLLGKPKDGRTA